MLFLPMIKAREERDRLVGVRLARIAEASYGHRWEVREEQERHYARTMEIDADHLADLEIINREFLDGLEREGLDRPEFARG